MTTTDKLIKLIKKSPYHSVIIASVLQQRAEELLSDEEKFKAENHNNIINPQLILDIMKDILEVLK